MPNSTASETDPSWIATELAIKWSLIEGDVDEKGRGMMLIALSKANVDFMGQFKDGFHRTQSSDNQLKARVLFDTCAEQDQRRVYNIGRKFNQQPPV